jgi:hypothetical protein
VPANPKDYEDAFLGPDDDEPPNRSSKKKGRQPVRRAGRLQPLPGAYVRVPIQWICQPRRGKYLLPPKWRLFHYVLYRSHWGQRDVPLTSKFLAEIKVSLRNAGLLVAELEKAGWLWVERQPGHVLVVRPIVLTG